ncbi:hypothetical protein BGZ82_003395 [Podila clonocystis]|nr:hypothetical protein BGZ82_003395 [Podila clonocystis]
MSDNRNSHPSSRPPNLPHEPGSGSSPSLNSSTGSQGTYADRAAKNTRWQQIHKVIFDAKGDSFYATHNPPVTNPFPGTVTYTGFPHDTNARAFHNACWDTVAPVSGYQAQREDNGTKSIFIGYNLNATQYNTKAEFDQYIMSTPINFGGQRYLPQVPIPANIDISKVYIK